MEEYIDIFDDIFEIKSKIPENIYLNLNNKIKKILDDLEYYRKKYENNDSDDDSDEEFEEESDEEIEEENTIVELGPCVCNTYWNFTPTPIEDVGKCFCMQNISRLKNCSNFIKLSEYCPLIKT